MKKEEEIARLLTDGAQPAELVRQGYARGTVYKVNRRLNQDSASLALRRDTETASEVIPHDESIETDPEVVGLKKALRKAQLERQLTELKAPIEMERRLDTLERKVSESISEMGELLWEVKENVDGCPVGGLRGRFRCSCGALGLVAARVICTRCDAEMTYGWFPGSQR